MLLRPFVLLLICLLLITPATAQIRKSSSRAANVKTGTLTAIDLGSATITLKSANGKETLYRYTEKTQMLKNKRPVEITTFNAGDRVSVRFRKGSVGPASLYDLCDKVSWDWLNRVRKETTKVKIKEIAEDELHAEEGADSAAISYRISEKTVWYKGGKPVTSEQFKTGEMVFVVPRSLSGGGIVAMAVSDSADSAAHLKERSKSTISGTLTTVDLPRRKIALRTLSNDSRDLILAEDCEARMAGRDVPLAALKIGQNVSAHLRRNEDDEQEVTRITIRSKRSSDRHAPSQPAKKKSATSLRPQ